MVEKADSTTDLIAYLWLPHYRSQNRTGVRLLLGFSEAINDVNSLLVDGGGSGGSPEGILRCGGE